MTPDYLCLSILRNHGATIILNAKDFKLWTIDQEMGTADPALKDVEAKGDDRNYNSLNNYPSRPANLALKDYMQKFRDWNGCQADYKMTVGRETTTHACTAKTASHRPSTAPHS